MLSNYEQYENQGWFCKSSLQYLDFKMEMLNIKPQNGTLKTFNVFERTSIERKNNEQLQISLTVLNSFLLSILSLMFSVLKMYAKNLFKLIVKQNLMAWISND